MISRKLLKQLTPAVIKEALAERRRMVQTERLAERRRKLMSALAVVDREMSKLEGQPRAERAPAVKRRGPGRPPKAEKPGRRKGYKLSAETRRRMSEAAKRRYARKAETATATA